MNPFVVAHRFGNSLTALRSIAHLGVRTVEADVHLFRGRLEVRHLKTVGPVPILWDRWHIASPFARRLVLDELLAAVAPGTHLLLDLKGRNRRLAERLAETLEPHVGRGVAVTLCSRTWGLLGRFADVDGIRIAYSVGSARQLRRLQAREGLKLDGVSIHERLLDAPTVRDLRRIADVVFSWPVNSVARAQELIAYGVDGLISDRPELVHPVAAAALAR